MGLGYLHLLENEEERKELARYFNRVGRGVNCRLDVPVIVLNDIKWAAVVFEDLAKQLTKIAFDGEKADIYRILQARTAMEEAKTKLHHKNRRAEALKLQRKNRQSNY